ncbi:MAG: hypothetical protein WBV83_16975 [Bradyrhizobium sp.]|jgi:hypothetical protein|uniref:hypothetical protein n=1 Tax=Bradyrhizobium sp. TaxID=376 RepID=UPI003C43ED76
MGLSAFTSLAGFAAFAAAVFSSQPSYSGQVDSERDEDYDLAFVGSARETGTLAPIPDVQVRAEMGKWRIMVRTNSEGVYKLYPSFGSDIKADQITISCAKDGYETVDVSRRQLSDKKVKELVVAECLMAPKP